MTLQQTLFIVSGAITLGGALMVVTRRNVLHAALFLILSFLGIAGLYALLEAPVLAMAQMLVYVRGIAILIVFVIILTRGTTPPHTHGTNRQWGAALVIATALWGILVWMTLSYEWGAVPGPATEQGVATPPGVQDFVLPLAVTPVLLLAALIGVITTARKR